LPDLADLLARQVEKVLRDAAAKQYTQRQRLMSDMGDAPLSKRIDYRYPGMGRTPTNTAPAPS
jgi:hypothetical protein